jgi:hypothetical protein
MRSSPPHRETPGDAAFPHPLPATPPRPADNLWGLIHDICLIWEREHPLFRRVMALGEVDPEVREVIEGREEQCSLAVDSISQRLMARYTRLGVVEALWVLTSFSVFDSVEGHARSLEETVDFSPAWSSRSSTRMRCTRSHGRAAASPMRGLESTACRYQQGPKRGPSFTAAWR